MRKLFFLLVAIFLFQSCTGGDAGPGTGSCPDCVGPTGSAGKLYALNFSGNSFLRFDGFSSLKGNISPEATVSGASTTFSGPQYLTYDAINTDMYISNSVGNSILVYNAPRGIDGNTAPDRVISGVGVVAGPKGIALDVTNDRLYVTKSDDTILVFAGATALDTTTAVADAIISSDTAFNALDGIYYDSANDRLYVCSSGDDSIQVFNDVKNWTGTASIAPDRILTGLATHLDQPVYVTLAGTELVVSNKAGNSITVYANADSVDGNTAPDRWIHGTSTTFSSPKQIFVDTENDALWVANSGAGSIINFKDFSTSDGNIAPTHEITGTNTQFLGTGTVSGIFVETSD